MLHIPSLGAPHMSKDEAVLFESTVRQSRRYLEFGTGGSSLVAVRAGLDAVVSVDSDPQWVDGVKVHPEIAPLIAAGTMSVLHGDIGPVREWGNPVDRTHAASWPKYISAAWSEWRRRESWPDIVLVDGRFRVACCLSVLMVMQSRPPQDWPTVLIHDFNDERPQYREVLDFYEIESQVDSLCKLKMRRHVSIADVFVRFLERQFDFG